jgi:hypothetical protein
MQVGGAMPRTAPMMILFSGAAQIAQVVLTNRKQGCTPMIAASGTRVPEAGGHGSIAVNIGGACFWQAQSDAEWVQVKTEGPVMGPGVVQFTVSPASAGMVRTAIVTLSGIAGSKVRGDVQVVIKQGQ